MVLHKYWCMHKWQVSIYSTIHLTTSLWQRDILQSPAYHTASSLSSGFRGIKAHTPEFMKSQKSFGSSKKPRKLRRRRICPELARRFSKGFLAAGGPLPSLSHQKTAKPRLSTGLGGCSFFGGRDFRGMYGISLGERYQIWGRTHLLNNAPSPRAS